MERKETKLKAEMARQRVEIERELQRRKINAEDECRIRAAKFKVALLQQRMDGQCSSDESQVGDKPYIHFAVNLPYTYKPSQSGSAYKFSDPVCAPTTHQDLKQSGANIF